MTDESLSVKREKAIAALAYLESIHEGRSPVANAQRALIVLYTRRMLVHAELSRGHND